MPNAMTCTGRDHITETPQLFSLVLLSPCYDVDSPINYAIVWAVWTKVGIRAVVA